MKQERGFSLVQVLISMALASGLGLVLMRQGELQKDITKGAEAHTQLTTHYELLKLHLSNKEVCENAFRNTPIPSGNPAIEEVLGSGSTVLLKATTGNKKAIGLTSYSPTSIKLIDFDDTLKVAVLSVDYEKNGDFYGAKNLNKKVRIRYQGTSVINTCTAAILELAGLKDSCEQMEGFEWDETQEKCRKKDMKLHISMHNASGNETKTLPGLHDFCTLATASGEDGYKDSTHRTCTVYPVRPNYRRWVLKSELNEGRSNYCNALCFSFKEPTSTTSKSIYYDSTMSVWDAAP